MLLPVLFTHPIPSLPPTCIPLFQQTVCLVVLLLGRLVFHCSVLIVYAVPQALHSALLLRHVFSHLFVGADPASSNAYFRSKGEAEALVAASGLSATIIRTPILLGPGTAGASALASAARNPKAKALGGGHYKMRPLDIDDLNAAIFNACKEQAAGCASYELVGPEAIAYCDLIKKTARKINPDSTLEVGSIPIGFTKLMAGITSTLRGGGFTPTVIDVITQDEEVSHNGFAELGVTLTSLDRTIEKILEK